MLAISCISKIYTEQNIVELTDEEIVIKGIETLIIIIKDIKTYFVFNSSRPGGIITVSITLKNEQTIALTAGSNSRIKEFAKAFDCFMKQSFIQ